MVETASTSEADENTAASDAPSSSNNDDGGDEKDENQEEGEKEEEEEEEEDDDDALSLLQSQVFTLTASLSTVSEEKTKIVATYQTEKRKLKVNSYNSKRD